MIKFITISNKDEKIKKYVDSIDKVMLGQDLYYEIHNFSSANNEFNELCKITSQSYLFIIDNDNSDIEAYEIISKLRKDYDLFAAFIIIIDKNNKVDVHEIHTRFSFLVDVIKEEDCYKVLERDLRYILKILYSRKKVFSFFQDKCLYKVAYGDILFIEKELNGKKCIIHTRNNTYHVFKSLSEIEQELDGRFIRTHQSALVNFDNVVSVDLFYNVIYFSDNLKCDLLSRNAKKKLKKFYSKYVSKITN